MPIRDILNLDPRLSMPRLYRSALLLLTFFVAVPEALAQTGKVQGTVTEAPTGDYFSEAWLERMAKLSPEGRLEAFSRKPGR